MTTRRSPGALAPGLRTDQVSARRDGLRRRRGRRLRLGALHGGDGSKGGGGRASGFPDRAPRRPGCPIPGPSHLGWSGYDLLASGLARGSWSTRGPLAPLPGALPTHVLRPVPPFVSPSAGYVPKHSASPSYCPRGHTLPGSTARHRRAGHARTVADSALSDTRTPPAVGLLEVRRSGEAQANRRVGSARMSLPSSLL